jgi:formylglycine-generating enzyme required for sulfatase activity
MDYLQNLELSMHRLQRKFHLLQDLRFFLETAAPDEIELFGSELHSVFLSSGAALGEVLLGLLQQSHRKPHVVATAADPKTKPPPPPDMDVRESKPSAAPDSPNVPTQAASAGVLEETVSRIEPSLRQVPAGSFIMGSEDDETERPPHKVALASYAICDHLVTCSEYALFLSANPQWKKDRADPGLRDEHYLEDWSADGYPKGRDDHPVAFVSWYAAEACASWLGLRLPTEAEWERAARGGLVGKKYPTGDQMNERLANFAKRMGGTTAVRTYEANAFGLYDMAGNLFEWTADWYGPYAAGDVSDPRGPSDGEYKVVRGGSWMSGAGALRVSARFDMDPRTCAQVGIRLAR